MEEKNDKKLNKIFEALDTLTVISEKSDIIKIGNLTLRFRPINIKEEIESHSISKEFSSKLSDDPTTYLYRFKIEVISRAVVEINKNQIDEIDRDAVVAYFRDLCLNKLSEMVVHYLFAKYNLFITSLEKKFKIEIPTLGKETPIEKDKEEEKKSEIQSDDTSYTTIDIPDDNTLTKEEVEKKNKELESKIETSVEENGKIVIHEKRKVTS